MRANKKESAVSKPAAKQKVMAVVLLFVFGVIGWQIVGLFTGGGSSSPKIQQASNNSASGNNVPAALVPAQSRTPQSAALPKENQPSEREMQLMRLQAETQAKYIAAVNELQMLKIQKQLAETNQAIAAAKLATVTAEKNIVDLLAPTPPPAPIKPATPVTSSGEIQPPPGQADNSSRQQVPYTVVSVSQANHKWNAVIGYEDQLYHVQPGDILPADNSVIASIDNGGVWLSSKDGVKRRLPLVPII